MVEREAWVSGVFFNTFQNISYHDQANYLKRCGLLLLITRNCNLCHGLILFDQHRCAEVEP